MEKTATAIKRITSQCMLRLSVLFSRRAPLAQPSSAGNYAHSSTGQAREFRPGRVPFLLTCLTAMVSGTGFVFTKLLDHSDYLGFTISGATFVERTNGLYSRFEGNSRWSMPAKLSTFPSSSFRSVSFRSKFSTLRSMLATTFVSELISLLVSKRSI